MNWTEEQLKQLPREKGFYLRGHDMTRVETFVAAAFAFCVTLIMISGSDIPKNIEQTKQAMLSIPAFLFAGAQLLWIWYAHAKWSKRFGLEDGKTVFLSGALIMLVLVYVYPMRMMASGMFAWLSGGAIESGYKLGSWDDLRFLFYFAAIGFALLGIVFWLLNRHAVTKAERLCLTEFEIKSTVIEGYSWLIVAATSGVIAILTFVVSGPYLPFVPMLYASFGITLPMLSRRGPREENAE